MKKYLFSMAIFTLMLSAQTIEQKGKNPTTPSSAQNYSYVQDVGTGQVDWTNRVIKCTGIGGVNPDVPPSVQRAGAIRAAKLDALRNILETIKGINIDAETTVENAITTSDVIHTKIQGIAKNFQVKDIRYMSDGSIEVDVAMALTGDFSDVLLPSEMGNMPPMTTPQAGGTYTGLIVDARGFKAQPAMAPKIITPDKNEVYGTGYVSREYAVDMGIAGYAKNLIQAKSDERVAPNPLIVKAIGVGGKNKTDIVISPQDAMLIQGYAQNLSFLQKCKVIIIVD